MLLQGHVYMKKVQNLNNHCINQYSTLNGEFEIENCACHW